MASTVKTQSQNLDPNDRSAEPQQWESMARLWLSKLVDGRTITPDDVEAWVQSNQTSLPDYVKSMPRPQLYEWFLSIHNSIAPQNEEKAIVQVDPSHARFQRTDQWRPVYSWLEFLDMDEVVKSKDILDWLSKNPEVREHLYSRHSRYHLMHYIKKCHVKILKRKEKKQGTQVCNKVESSKVNKLEETKPPAPLPSNNLSSIPKDGELYIAKRNEAFSKYEILVELEKQLSAVYPKPQSIRTQW